MKKEFTAEELRMIWRNTARGTAGLYVPVSHARRAGKLGPRLAVFKSFSEVAEGEDPAEKYWEKLNEAPLTPSLSTLSAVNLILALAAIDHGAHRALNQTFVREEYLRKLAGLGDGGPQPDIQVAFTRAGILANLKALMAVGPEGSPGEALDLHLIGDLTLLCNDFVGGTYIKGEPGSVDNIHLMIEFVATWELDNPRVVEYGLTRVVRMIKTHLPGDDPEVVRLRKASGLNPGALTYDGLDIDDYIAVIFGIHAHGRGLNLEKVFQNPGEAVIDPKTFVSQTSFPREKLEHFLNKRSLSLQGFRELITGGEGWDKEAFLTAIRSDQFAADTLAFKTYPLLQWSEGRTLIVDIQYVSEILIYGLYWRIVDQLGEGKSGNFISLWGRLFELYLFDLFRHFYPEAAGVLGTDVGYAGGQIDALLDFGDYVIVFEFKASLLKGEAKSGRDIPLFEKEVSLKFIENEKGKPKALRQLANAASAVRGEAVKTTMRPRLVYPVLVGYEPVLESFFVNGYLQEKFRPLVAEDEDGVVVKPITVMSVDELEALLPNIAAGKLTWKEILEERFDRDRVKAFSVHQALYDLGQKKRVEVERNGFLMEGFDEIFAEISSRYRRDNGAAGAPLDAA